jgi:hypothetical protein
MDPKCFIKTHRIGKHGSWMLTEQINGWKNRLTKLIIPCKCNMNGRKPKKREMLSLSSQVAIGMKIKLSSRIIKINLKMLKKR